MIPAFGLCSRVGACERRNFPYVPQIYHAELLNVVN